MNDKYLKDSILILFESDNLQMMADDTSGILYYLQNYILKDIVFYEDISTSEVSVRKANEFILDHPDLTPYIVDHSANYSANHLTILLMPKEYEPIMRNFLMDWFELPCLEEIDFVH